MRRLFLLFPLLFIPFSAKAQIFVDAGNGAAATKDGTTWAKAYDSLSVAITNATAGDTIVVKGGGLFKPTNKADRSISFTIAKALVIYGGFAGTETGTHAKDILAARPANFVQDTLSGDIGTVGTDSDNSKNVVKVTVAGAILDGFAITGGYGGETGTGVHMTGNSTLRNLEIYSNSTTSLGTGGGAHTSTGTISHSVIRNNSAYNAGGLYISFSTKVLNCVIHSNTASNNAAGVNIANTSLLVNSTLYNNTATNQGGGLYVSTPGTKIYNNLIYDNTAGSADNGHEVYNQNSASATFSHNLVKGADAAAAIKGTAFSATPGCIFTTTSPFASTTETDANFLHLTSTSEALQAGLNSQVTWALDLKGEARIAQGAVDIGAYEGTYTPKVVYVDASATGSKDGTSWANAYDSLHLALNASNSADTLFVKSGGVFQLQNPTATIKDTTLSFTLKGGMQVYGGFAGTETGTAAEILAKRPSNFVKDTLSGRIGTGTDDKVYHVVTIAENEAVLDGFVITGGKANGASANNYDKGGGVYMTGNSILRNLEIHANGASKGAGIYISKGTLVHSLIHGNTNTDNAGGGIFADGAALVLNNLVYDNTCGSGSVGGGIIVAQDATVQLLNNTIYDNEAPNWRGGGIYIQSGNSGSVLINNLIYGNTAGNEGKNVYNEGNADITFTHNLVEGANLGAAINGTHPSSTTGCVFTTTDPFISTTATDPNFLRIRRTSGAWNGGNNARLPDDLTTDLAGAPRIVGAAVDMGAYELAPAQTFFVAADATGTKDGTTWTNAFDSLHLALAAARIFDTLFVKGGGTFKPTNKTDRTKAFTIDKPLFIFGGLAGTETGTAPKILAARPANFVKDTLSGDIGTAGTNSDNSYHVVVISAAEAVLDGFAITGGKANGTGDNKRGAGVYMTANSTLRNLDVHHNETSGSSTSNGGGVDMSAGTLTHSRIHRNESRNGGGVFLSGSAKALNCVIYNNEMTNSGKGGGVHVAANSTALLVNNTIHNNTSKAQLSEFGGGLYINTGNTGAKLYNNLIYGNTASSAASGHEVLNVTAGATFENNLVKGTNEAAAIRGTAFNSTPNCIFTTTSPFASTTEADANFLHLTTTTAALQAGTNSQVTWEKDLAGAARIGQYKVDIGAYEGTYPGRVRYIDAGNSAAATKDGTSWANAYDSLHLAIAEVGIGDTLFVKGGGLFKPTNKADRTISFIIAKAISIYGGLAGTETGTTAKAILAQRPANFVKDTLSGDIGTVGTKTDNSYHVVRVTANEALLDGFAITGGYADGSGNNKTGAGVYITANSRLRNLELYQNETSGSFSNGGGAYMTAGTLTHSLIHHNGSRDGGGLYLAGSAKVFNCVIYSNEVKVSGSAGGVYVAANSAALLVSNTIHNNSFSQSSFSEGGGLYIDSGNTGTKLYNNLIYGNRATHSGNNIYNKGNADVTFTHNLVEGANVGAAINGTAPSNTTGCVFTTTNPFASTTETDANYLHLNATTEAIQAGDNSRITWEKDLAGENRIIQGAVDIGAYESNHKKFTAIALSATSVAHLTAANVKVGDLSATTEGLGDNPTITYSLKDADAENDTFKVVGAELKTNQAIDYELLHGSHSPITIVASHTPTGESAVTYEKSFTITITPPTITGVSPTNLDILSATGANKTVGKLTATGTHLPAGGAGISFSITGGNDAEVFRIEDNTLKTAKSVPSEPNSYTLQVSARYAGIEGSGDVRIRVLTPAITAINTDPTSLSVAHGTAANTDVATLSATHKDLEDNPTFTYSIKERITTTTPFKVEANKLKTNLTINKTQIGDSYKLTLIASHTPSGGGDPLTKEKEITIAITGTTAPAPTLATLETSDTYLYPNPTTDLLHLRSTAKIKRLRLLNESGAVLLKAKRTNTLNISSLPAGTYILELVTTDGHLRLPVLKH